MNAAPVLACCSDGCGNDAKWKTTWTWGYFAVCSKHRSRDSIPALVRHHVAANAKWTPITNADLEALRPRSTQRTNQSSA